MSGSPCNLPLDDGESPRRSAKEVAMGTGTASGGIAIERRYSSHAQYSPAAYGSFGDEAGIAGVIDPILTKPIDFGAELAERERTHEPLPPVNGDLTNTDFGI